MSIEQKLTEVRKSLPEGVKLVAVSKTKSVETILEVYQAGHTVFGENKVQELVDKHALLPHDIEWHHIGHLQTNKVKFLAPFVSMIHAVDSMKLLKEINKHAIRNDRVIPCLLQVHIADEETKFGLSEDELFELIDELHLAGLNNVSVNGLMGMATFTDDSLQVRKEFRFLKGLFDRISLENKNKLPDFRELSMGMSGDFQIAIDEGSTIVRVGSLIFGERH